MAEIREWPAILTAGGYPEPGAVFPECDRLLYQITGEPPASSRGPLGSLVKPGDTIVVKPNLVRDIHPHGLAGVEAITTHPAVTAAVVRAASLAVGAAGTVIVCDTPLQSADFAALVAETRLERFLEEANVGGARIRLIDLRTQRLQPAGSGAPFGVRQLPGDPAGYETVDLRERSKLQGLQHSARFAVGDYDPSETSNAHRQGHAYTLSRTVLDADLIVSVPKLKTHCKAGMTGALKNFIGVCGQKSFLPHFRRGSPATGGDEFASNSALKGLHREAVSRLATRHPRTFGVLRQFARPTLRLLARVRGEDPGLLRSLNGSWPGNDTLWRTVHDVHAATKYWSDGRFQPSGHGRRILYVLDAMVSGHGHGPLLCEPVRTGCLIGGRDPVAIDFLGAVLLGIDPASLPVLVRALDAEPYPLGLTGVALADACQRAFALADNLDLPATQLPAGWESVRAHRRTA